MPLTHEKKFALRTAGILAAICLGALILRFSLAGMPGFEFDVGVNQGWAKSAVQLGLGKSYSEQVDGNMLPNYPPFSLLVFTSTGYAFKTFFSPEYDKGAFANRILIKTPSILADIVTLLLLYVMVRKWKGRKEGLIAAAVYAVHPAVFYNSAVWGQTDALYGMFLVACLAALSLRQHAVTGILIALALLTKAQAIMLVPLIGFVLLLRGWRPVLFATCAAIVTAVIVLLPFAPDNGLHGIVKMYSESVGYYPTLSSNAYNFWWSLFSDSAGSTQDHDLLFGVIAYRKAGMLLFSIAYVFSLFTIWRFRKSHTSPNAEIPLLFFAAAIVAYAFFLFNTEMHERYFSSFVAFALPLVFLSRKAAWLYAGVTFVLFWNLLGVLPASPIDRAVFGTFPAFDVLLASCLTFLFPCFALLYRQLPQWKTRAPVRMKLRRAIIRLKRFAPRSS